MMGSISILYLSLITDKGFLFHNVKLGILAGKYSLLIEIYPSSTYANKSQQNPCPYFNSV